MIKSYKITFQLATPISFIAPPTFDGILSYAYARETLGDKFEQKLSISKEDMLDFSAMPIVMHPKGYFMASVIYYDAVHMTQFTERWRKRWDSFYDFLIANPIKIRTQQGKFKSYDVPYPLKDIKQVWFYFQSEDVAQVEYLLNKWIPALGKKRGHGNGDILHFAIEETDFDFDNQMFRPIPADLVEVEQLMNKPNFKFSLAYCSWRNPYWATENMSNCITV